MAARPAFVKASFEPCSAASLPACSSHGQGERPDRTHLLLGAALRFRPIEEVPAVQFLGDAADRDRGRPPRLGADRDPAEIDQAQNRRQILGRHAFHVAPLQPNLVERLRLARGNVAVSLPLDRRRQFVRYGKCSLGRRRDELQQALRHLGGNDDCAARITVSQAIQEEAQREGQAVVALGKTLGERSVLGAELMSSRFHAEGRTALRAPPFAQSRQDRSSAHGAMRRVKRRATAVAISAFRVGRGRGTASHFTVCLSSSAVREARAVDRLMRWVLAARRRAALS